MVDDDVGVLAERPGWTVENAVATYCPTPGGWCVRVRPVRVAGRTYARLHVAIVDPSGTAQHALFASTRLAEGQVRGRQPPAE